MAEESEHAMNLSVDAPADLEERVRKLEQSVHRLEDTTELEERITERVTARLEQVVAADERITSKAPVQAAPSPPPDLPPVERARYPWLFFDMVTSARLLFRMPFDHRYRMAWTTHLVVWTCLPAIFLSSWWFPLSWVPFVGHFAEKVLDLLLAFCVYKALSRELRRYRELRRM